MIVNWNVVSALALALAVSPVFAQGQVDRNSYEYLALGDSISYGFDPTLFVPNRPLPKPKDFVGYPEILERTRAIKTTINTSCPGETSASFIVVGAPDNGCNGTGPQGQPPFKPTIGLHVNYPGMSQLQFAVAEIRRNRNIRLVSLSIGGNDLVLLQALCSAPGTVFATCVSERLPGVLAQYAGNLTLILNEIRQREGYSGELVLMTNYVPNKDPLFTLAVSALNSTMRAVGLPFGAKFADGFTAFQLASLRTGGDPCAAGLLIRLGPGVCDIHPSDAGQGLLALTMLAAR